MANFDQFENYKRSLACRIIKEISNIGDLKFEDYNMMKMGKSQIDDPLEIEALVN